jgi:hypothetical protein
MISLIDADSGRMIPTAITLPQAIDATPTGLTITGELTFEEWAAIGQNFGRGMKSVAWCVGDWLVYGEANFARRVTSEAYDAAVAATGLDRTTLKTYASVCRTIPHGKRIEALNFDHHKSLAALPADKREDWMKVVTSQPSAPSARRLRASIRIAGDSPRIATDDEIMGQGARGGHDNYVPHLSRLLGILRKTVGSMDEDQRAALKEDAQPLLAILQAL